jgi:hypothetical protein
MISPAKAFLTNHLQQFAQTKIKPSNRKQYFNPQLFEVVGNLDHVFCGLMYTMYFNPSTAFYAVLCETACCE